ncbi:MAG TPA: GNAT family protein [Planctomicrobium sp.]|nr:GNAT family protein [Planctomicrobium sp.]
MAGRISVTAELMDIRKSNLSDLPRIMEIYDKAREFMASAGNSGQWRNGYPRLELIQQDIENGNSYICLDDGNIVATFFFAVGDDPTYAVINDGQWLNAGDYGVVHRIAVDSTKKGTATHCLNWCFAQIGNMRIDTHENNVAMQRVLQKCGFIYCGKILKEDGTSRIAFQRG